MGNTPTDFFEGRSRHTLDEKGRLAIPARFREILKKRGDSSLVVTNLSTCLVAFASDDWQSIKEKAVELPLFDTAANTYIRYFISVPSTYIPSGVVTKYAITSSTITG